MRDFKITALAYITEQALETVRASTEAEVTDALLTRLREKPWLLVLDGLERVLAAYHRSDAAQAQDDDIEGDTGLKDRKPTDCIRPIDDDLFRSLAAAAPSKFLTTSRLVPHVFLRFGTEVPGVTCVALSGLAPERAEEMLRNAGVKGLGVRMRGYLNEAFGCHPLVVGFIAGLIRHSPWAEMSFERWEDDPRGGAAVNLADPNIKNRRTNILKLAFDALEPMARELLARMGMLASAVRLDVLEALNPTRPDPPNDVELPTTPGARQDFVLNSLQERLRNVKTDEERVNLERQIVEHHLKNQQMFETAVAAHASYQSALRAWQESPEVRTASRWLSDTLADLESRGHLQWDRAIGMFDLHPVVRGYAIGRLDTEARAVAGQRVADHFASRAAPDYTKVTSLNEMANQIQVVRALNLAGKLREAGNALTYDMRNALFRIERHDELLALLRPQFPNGWTSRPSDVGLLSGLAASATFALGSIERYAEADAQASFVVNRSAAIGLVSELSIGLQNHAVVLGRRNFLAQRDRALLLAQTIAEVSGNQTQLIWCNIRRVADLLETGQAMPARTLRDKMAINLDWQGLGTDLQGQITVIDADLRLFEGTLAVSEVHEIIAQVQGFRLRFHELALWRLLGQVHQSIREYNQAADAFGHAIQMARDVGLSDPIAEARRGLSLIGLESIAGANAAATSAELHVAGRPEGEHHLSELWLALGERDKARDHALRGYKWAWADGPPYSRHWELERCRAVLRALGQPEPVLPPYDPAKIDPLPYEADINRMLEEHAKRKPN